MKFPFFMLLPFALLLTGCETAPRSDLVVRFFNDIAFRGTPGGYPLQGEAMLDTNYFEHRMHRWEDEIRVGISGAVTQEYRQWTKSIVTKMSDVTGLTARVVSSESEAPNLTIEFVDVKNFLIRKTETVPCYASNSGDKEIETVTIKISVDNPKIVKHCIAHELFHGFGFVHSNLIRSVISTLTLEEELTQWDEMALQTLYDHRLQSGMTRQEAMPIARRIILEKIPNLLTAKGY